MVLPNAPNQHYYGEKMKKNNKLEGTFSGDITAKPGDVYPYVEVNGNVFAADVADFKKTFPNLVKVGGYLYLNALTSIPEGFNPTVGGGLDLNALTSIPEGFNPTVGGGLYLRSLTSIPEGFNPTVGGGLDLRSLTSIPEGLGNNIDALDKCRSLLLSSFAAAGFSFADGILARIVSKRGPVMRVVICGKTEVSYLVTDGEAWSHGETLAAARESLIYKIGSRDASEYKAWTLDRKVTKAEAIKAYRIITGACEGGVRAWLGQRETPETTTVEGVIDRTKGAYGAEVFKKFFSAPAPQKV